MACAHDDEVPTCDKVLVIGAGPAGLAAAAALQELDVPFDLVDRSRDVGGVWNPDDPHSPSWPGLRAVSSVSTTQFDDLLMPASFPAFPTAEDMAKYLRAYTAHHGLSVHFRGGVTVRSATPFGQGRWQVELSTGEVVIYRALVSAHGISQRAALPDWAPPRTRTSRSPGHFEPTVRHSVLEGEPLPPVEVLHSSAWAGAESVAHRSVLVVGSGQSAADIAVEAAGTAREVRLAMREGHWVVPRRIGPLPGDMLAEQEPALLGQLNARVAESVVTRMVGTPQAFGLPAPQRSLLSDTVIVSDDLLDLIRSGAITPTGEALAMAQDGTVTFTPPPSSRPGVTSVETTWRPDIVVFATGYRPGCDHLDDDLLPHGADGSWDLFLGAFPRVRDDLVVLGQIQVSGGTFPIVREQARIAARILRSYLDTGHLPEAFRQARASGVPSTLIGPATQRLPEGPRQVVGRFFGALRAKSLGAQAQSTTQPSDRTHLLGQLRTLRAALAGN
ncbi:flavin-containing monooxygenase [Devriesea agamarum]|uniref:flavin-containing monooxygenase n=1 Tax=Devriesea agamarum TaxID=472569 RepID=UPI00071D67A8|nr:SidA/IucD/PvdA family monooxygenase [Devriesea agamarum]